MKAERENEFPALAIGETPVWLGDGWWTNGSLISVGTPGEGVEGEIWRRDPLDPEGVAAQVRRMEYALENGDDITTVRFLLDYRHRPVCEPVVVLNGLAHDGLFFDTRYLAYFIRHFPGCRLFYGPMRADASDLSSFVFVIEARGSLVGGFMGVQFMFGAAPIPIPGSHCFLPAEITRELV